MCPNPGSWRQTSHMSDEDDWSDDDVEIPPAGEDLDNVPIVDALHFTEGISLVPAETAGRVLNIVDISGVHQLVVKPCHCTSSSDNDDIQLLRMGLFPASFEVIKTVFTFNVLEDLRHDNIVCNTTAYQYYNKLRRVTSPAFPHTVPVRC